MFGNTATVTPAEARESGREMRRHLVSIPHIRDSPAEIAFRLGAVLAWPLCSRDADARNVAGPAARQRRRSRSQ